MSNITFIMAARCEAAGRFNNEDNFQLIDDLTSDQWGFITDKEVVLGEIGALLLVCDGMGGMNSGEIASELTVATIKEWFASEKLTKDVLISPETIMQYMEDAIVAADDKIKVIGKQNREHEGMGSTIVIAWLVGANIYVGWCGDSRAYRYNPALGFERLTHDHSYVQELVDSGKLSNELAFDHPDSNIITRSLGDSRKKARPDIKRFPLYNNDIILLCSDGLSGVLRDSEMGDIIAQNSESMESCRKALWNESEKAGWNDNVTIALCKIVSGAENAIPNHAPVYESKLQKKKRKKLIVIALFSILLLVAVFEIGYYISKQSWWNPFNRYQLCN